MSGLPEPPVDVAVELRLLSTRSSFGYTISSTVPPGGVCVCSIVFVGVLPPTVLTLPDSLPRLALVAPSSVVGGCSALVDVAAGGVSGGSGGFCVLAFSARASLSLLTISPALSFCVSCAGLTLSLSWAWLLNLCRRD